MDLLTVPVVSTWLSDFVACHADMLQYLACCRTVLQCTHSGAAYACQSLIAAMALPPLTTTPLTPCILGCPRHCWAS